MTGPASFTMPIIRDPGVGDGRAEIGSEQWARRVRADLGLRVPSISHGPKGVAGLLRVLREREGWRLLADKDGRTFTSLEDFCETPTPWGLGTKLADLERWISADGPASAPLYWTPPQVYPPTEDETGTIEVHPAASLFPMLPDDALAALADDIKANGLREPVVLWEEKVIDGRNRMTACQMVGVRPTFTTLLHCPDPVAYVLSANLHRRHLTDDDRAFCAARMKAHYQEKTAAAHAEASRSGGRGKKKTVKSGDLTVSGGGYWYDLAAADWHTSASAVQRADTILSQEAALPELQEAVKVTGTVTLSGADTIAKAVRSGAVSVEEAKVAVASKDGAKELAQKIRDAKPKRPGKGGGKSKAPAKDDVPPSKPAPPTRHPALVAIDTAADLDALGRALTAANADASLTDKEEVGAAYQKRSAALREQSAVTPAAPAPVSTQAAPSQPKEAAAPASRQLSLVDEEEDYGEPDPDEPDEPTVSTVLPGESEAALLLTQLSECIRPLALQGRLDKFRVALAALLAEWSDS